MKKKVASFLLILAFILSVVPAAYAANTISTTNSSVGTVTSPGNAIDGNLTTSTTLTSTGSTTGLRYQLNPYLPTGSTFNVKIYAKSSNASQTLVVQPEGSSQAAIGAYVTKTATNNEGWLTYSFTSVPGNVALLYIYTQQAGTLDLFEIQVDGYSGTTPPPGIPSGLTATGGNTKVDLNWTAVSGATSYNVKRSTTAGGPYTPIATNVTGTTYTDTAVINGTTYYYIVTAVNAVGESANSNEASATPAAPVTNRALLVITLVNGLEKEYDLSMDEVNAFINWYNGRAGGTGSEVYAFNKNFNLANFLSRKEYISYSKIETFEVNEYKVTQP